MDLLGRCVDYRFRDRIPCVRKLFMEKICQLSNVSDLVYQVDIDKTMTSDYWVEESPFNILIDVWMLFAFSSGKSDTLRNEPSLGSFSGLYCDVKLRKKRMDLFSFIRVVLGISFNWVNLWVKENEVKQ
jgi:hypothetical protein